MPVSPETEWVLIASGLIAHADDELDGNEVERLMAIIDEQIPEEDYSDWLSLIGDKARLEAHYAALPDPPEAQHRVVLEQAWTMAMVDGDRSAAELVVLARIAERFGVEPMQLEFWRAAWTEAEQELAIRVAELAVVCLSNDDSLDEDDHSPFLDLIERLPTSHDERERLGALATQPPVDSAELARALAAMPRARRLQAFTLVAPLIQADAARARYIDIAKTAGLRDIAI
ncbi:tellurite resistance TerB family protein [Enhygromyxa salina]|uniref:Tellurite resistance protein TerB n=1 Tax=Enhygromyxa salina TaxID=215803 RepID=A0A2S9YS92_9BACT|nr:TerB family tellurite resistance protein [Enhygromyxa salina]PRQ07963.1 Tellurite resistance protein TerB [Enhygromyxa salina]